ncbi:MAG: hypothetical protein IPG17_18865 [Sandaracinaceae bacterium]|nr:hypothetical protein [Sandaracinaceae bacterium]MBK7153659.1 hypothetical protein [Sandaracinaceae bacterium]MBK7775160.1 hypothetical protein [Sandaracinaceae bacterium]MBP7682847.1 hypothetical protein [Deltaproteobacteria bacterium]
MKTREIKGGCAPDEASRSQRFLETRAARAGQSMFGSSLVRRAMAKSHLAAFRPARRSPVTFPEDSGHADAAS